MFARSIYTKFKTCIPGPIAITYIYIYIGHICTLDLLQQLDLFYEKCNRIKKNTS